MTQLEVSRIAREAARCAVQETFTALGVDMSKPPAMIEVQQDFAWLRNRRILESKIRFKAFIVLTTLIVGGVAAAGWAIITGR